MELSENEKEILLQGARGSIKEFFQKSPPVIIDYNQYPKLKENNGAFVTLNKNNELRGCIGYIISPYTLYETVYNAARQAAFNDPRFYPLEEKELDKIQLEISVLSKPVPIENYDEIKIGVHGVLLDYNGLKSILLPQVALHHNYTVQQFLDALFEKAGLHPHLHRKNFIPINVFTAIVFSEKEKEGKI